MVTRERPNGVSWQTEKVHESAHDFHQRDPGRPTQHQLWWERPPTPALVLGSTQPFSIVNRAAATADGVEVCRRRSGGGLVYLDPATDCWIDAIIPAGSPLWHDDVGHTFRWFGEHWAKVLAPLLTGGPTDTKILVHSPSPGRKRDRTKPVWCFADFGHGEITVNGWKILGLSQRRTRHWVRLQSLVLGHWPGANLRHYIAAPAPPNSDPTVIKAGPPPGMFLPNPDDICTSFLESLANTT